MDFDRLRRSLTFALLALLLIAGLDRAEEKPEGIDRPGTLPFSVSVATRPLSLDVLSLYIDSPMRQVVMDGAVWVMAVQPDPYSNPVRVLRWKGPDFEHMVRQPDGAADFPQRTAATFINSGLWFDKTTGTLYALMHGEYERDLPDTPWCRKKVWLATSKDLGLHWNFVGDIATAVFPNLGDRSRYSGSEFEMGTADYDLYVDTRGGYFYATFWNGFLAKHGNVVNHLNAGCLQVARCALSDKMAPGKWFKFCHGGWTEPALGGKASRVAMTDFGLYGNTIYSTYLHKYVRIGVSAGTGDPRWPNVGLKDHSVYISTCTDLGKQDWTPMANVTHEPDNPFYGFTLAGDQSDPSICGQTLHAYNYWVKTGRILDLTFGKGTTPEAAFPEHGSYSYEAHPESGDVIEGRHTKITGCASGDMHYAGNGWSDVSDPLYFHGRVKRCSTANNSVEFSFRGADIYWRAVPCPNGGRADVFIDGQLQKTVDLYFEDTPLTFEFAFIKTGLDARVTHTIKIVARGDKNEKSSGTVIDHMAFEYSAESYWASAGYTGVAGKNNWRYQSRHDLQDNDLFYDSVSDSWIYGGKCTIGINYEIPTADLDANRKWVAPHDGTVRIEGSASIDGTDAAGFEARVMKNADAIWSAQLASPDKGSASHDATVPVHAGDAVLFVVHKNAPPAGSPASQAGNGATKVMWDPVITYVEAAK